MENSDPFLSVEQQFAESIKHHPDRLSRINLLASEKLDMPYELVLRNVIPDFELDTLRMELERLIRTKEGNELRKQFDELMAKQTGDAKATIVRLKDLRNDTLMAFTDVGFGLGQVFPLLAEVVAEESKLLCIEQPEIHLHPKMQADLADVFISGRESDLYDTLNRNVVRLLETHSEHLILRLLRLVRKNSEGAPNAVKVLPEDLAVSYVDVVKGQATVTHLPVTEEGDFSREWPQGFFTERFEEYD